MYKHTIKRNKRGTSLVEILVVMVVLLIGIMTLVQMFPTGFRVVRAGESRSIATRLAQAELERWKSMQANLPEAIGPCDEDFGVAINTDEFAGPPFEDYKKNVNGGWMLATVHNGVTRYVRGNAFNFRQIICETTDVPAPSFFGSGGGNLFGSRYTLAFSPIDVTRDDPNDPKSELLGMRIKSGDLKRMVFMTADLPYLKPGNYGIRYDLTQSGARTYFHVSFPKDAASQRTYYISYSYWASQNNGEPELFTVMDQAITTGGAWFWQWNEVDIPAPPNGYQVIALDQGSDTCARGFMENSGNWRTDPYEFKLVDPILGVIAFNPYGKGIMEYTANGLRPLQARISYRRYDTRIIREDKVAPQPTVPGGDISIKMALRYILNLGDPTDNPDEETYKGLINSPLATVPVPVYVVDLATGLQVQMVVTGSNNQVTDYYRDIKEAGGKLDYKTGIITLPSEADLIEWDGTVVDHVTLPGRHLRFFYRADGDWSVQCHKACTNYVRVYNASDLRYNTYLLQAPNRLIFPACQGEQTISVDYSYSHTPDDGKGEHRTAGYCAQIQRDLVTKEWFVDLPLDPGYDIKRISVVGISLRARVIWRDEGAWRFVDLDTTLTKN